MSALVDATRPGLWSVNEASSPELMSFCREAYKKGRAWKTETELQFLTSLLVLGLIQYEMEIMPKEVEAARAVGENGESSPGTTYGKVLTFPRKACDERENRN